MLAADVWICSSQFGAIGSPSTLTSQRYQIAAVVKYANTDSVVLLVNDKGRINSCRFHNQVKISVGAFCKVVKQKNGSYALQPY